MTPEPIVRIDGGFLVGGGEEIVPVKTTTPGGMELWWNDGANEHGEPILYTSFAVGSGRLEALIMLDPDCTCTPWLQNGFDQLLRLPSEQTAVLAQQRLGLIIDAMTRPWRP